EALNDMNEILVPELKIYEKDQLDSGFALFQNNPNPFSNQTTIRFRLAESGKARLKVMDATGKTFIEKQLQLPEGYHEIYLDAKELNGPGLYMYSLETEKQKAVARMILIK
ncbi:MAG TPA: T9SS type A sorting domain-containing protein, partial [Saprospiraceae bacterium]|nr:T9SS type A sorting domain-containing protein [Saprospiraceae bacterium]